MRAAEADAGKTLRLGVGEALELDLAENPTTGHRWRIASGGAPVLRLDADVFVPPAPAGDEKRPPPGRPGRHDWTFTAVAPGRARIALEYRRPFGGAPPARRFELDVEVHST